MKRLIIAFAIVATSVCAQAAQVKWQIQAGPSFADLDMRDHNGNTFSSGTAYLILASDASTALANLAAGNDFGVTSYGSNTSWDGLTGGMTASIESLDTLSTAQALQFAVVLIQDDGGDIWYKVSSPSAAVTPSANLEALPADVMFDASSHLAGAWATAAVPEPTSGLLLLIGVAGLALKRRHA